MKVLKSNVLCKLVKSESPKTKIGGFVVPDDQKEYQEAEIISVGEEVKGLAEKDHVYIYTNSGKEIKVDGETYRVINVSEVIVVL